MADPPRYPYPGSPPVRGPEELYASPPPWDIGHPQPAFVTLAHEGAFRGQVLDVGCGTGEHALMAAGLGLTVVGIDLATNALCTAEQKARDRGLIARFIRHDARRLAELGETFDTVLDCGLFHIFDGDDRAAYVDSLRAATRPGARYFMLGFSDRQPGDWGPHRLTHAENALAFTEGWRIDSLEPATIEVTIDPAGMRAWLLTATRI
jgi:SAM-dependent methyltransferase